jgi:hypothetical protein
MTVEAIRSSEKLDLTRATRRHIPEDGILHSHRREQLKVYKENYVSFLQSTSKPTKCSPRWLLGFFVTCSKTTEPWSFIFTIVHIFMKRDLCTGVGSPLLTVGSQTSKLMKFIKKYMLWISVNGTTSVRSQVFKAVTKKNAVFWDVTPCGFCKHRRFGGNSISSQRALVATYC